MALQLSGTSSALSHVLGSFFSQSISLGGGSSGSALSSFSQSLKARKQAVSRMNVTSAHNTANFNSATFFGSSAISGLTFNSKTAGLLAKYESMSAGQGTPSSTTAQSASSGSGQAGVQHATYQARARRTDEYRQMRNDLVTSQSKDLSASGDTTSAGSRGNDHLTVSGSGNKTFGSYGTETFTITGNSNLASGHQGEDIFTVSGNNNTISGGSDNDTITVTGGTGNKIYSGADDDQVTVSASAVNTTVDFGTGDSDTLVIQSAASNYTVTEDGADLVFSNKTNGNTIRVTNDSADHVQFSDQTLTRNDIQDVIDNQGGDIGGVEEEEPITGTNTNSSSTIDLTDLADTVTFTGDNNTVNALNGNDTLTNASGADGNTYNLGGGNDSITIQGTSDDTIVAGGTGTDSITLSGDFADYTFADAGGGSYTLTHNSNGGVTTFSGVENVTFDDGTQSLQDLVDTLPATGIDNSSSSTINLTNNADTVEFTGDNNTINGLDGADVLTNAVGADGNTYNLGAGDDVIRIQGTSDDTTINGGTGTDNMTMAGDFTDYTFADAGGGSYTLTHNTNGGVTTFSNIDSVTFDDGTQSMQDLIDSLSAGGTNNDSNSTINLTGSADTIEFTGDNNTINGLDGDDVLTNANGATGNTYNLGNGNDSITVERGSGTNTSVNGGSGTDTLTVEGNYADYTVYNLGSGNYRLIDNVSGDEINYNGVENFQFADTTKTSAQLSSAAYTVYSVNNDDINLGSSADKVVINGDDNDLDTGSGNDSVIIMSGSDDSYVDLGDGNDTITMKRGFGNAWVDGEGGSGDKMIMEGDYADYTLQDLGSDHYLMTDTVTGDTVEVDDVESFQFADTTKTLAQLLSDKLGGGGGGGTSGADTFTIEDDGGWATINGLGGNDTFNVDEDADEFTLDGGDGDDTFNVDSLYSDHQLVIRGGAGTDTIDMYDEGWDDYEVTDFGSYVVLTNENEHTITIYDDVEFVKDDMNVTKTFAQIQAMA